MTSAKVPFRRDPAKRGLVFQAIMPALVLAFGFTIFTFTQANLRPQAIAAGFDLKTTQVTPANPEWRGFSAEAYVFISILYFLGCFSMSNLSRRLEKDLSRR